MKEDASLADALTESGKMLGLELCVVNCLDGEIMRTLNSLNGTLYRLVVSVPTSAETFWEYRQQRPSEYLELTLQSMVELYNVSLAHLVMYLSRQGRLSMRSLILVALHSNKCCRIGF